MTVATICMKMAILIFLGVGMYCLIKWIQAYDPMLQIREKVDDLDRQRILDSGNRKKNRFERSLDRLDEQLTQSGLKKILPKATVEIFVLFNVLEFTLVFLLAGEGILIPFLEAGMAVYLNKLIVELFRYRNKRITEKHLLELLNLISDFSISENEITTILYKCGQLMPEPLRSALIQCHMTTRSTGNTEQALYELRRGNDHFLFKEIILLLELCSHSDSNYQKVVTGCREMVNSYLKEEKEKTSVVRGLIGEAALMTGVALYGISTMLREFAGDVGLGNNIVDFFFYNPAGRICLIIYAALFFAMIQVILKFAKR
ncbi:MAG: hypothetical protein IJZ34_12000 [Lachnospiraceae bacterium]|nr:hypothetical protein [Lachnospiraceae bacterium]